MTTNGETGINMTNGPERVESAQNTPAMSADSILGKKLLVAIDALVIVFKLTALQ